VVVEPQFATRRREDCGFLLPSRLRRLPAPASCVSDVLSHLRLAPGIGFLTEATSGPLLVHAFLTSSPTFATRLGIISWSFRDCSSP